MTGMELALAWARAIKEDATLADLCAAHFHKPLTVGVGYDMVREFGRGEAPYVYIHPVTDEGGPEGERREYVMALYLGIVADKKDMDIAGVQVNTALHVMDTEFAPAVLAALDELDTPPLQGEGTLWPPEKGFCEKHITLSYSEDQPLAVKNPWR